MQEKSRSLPNESAKTQDSNWDDVRIFLALARAGTFAEAARQLGVNESTVLRRMQRLAARLDVRLFERSSGRLVPTEGGKRLLREAELAEASIFRAEATVSGQNRAIAGLVRITAVPILANRLLVPALPPLLAAHPALEVEVIAEPGQLSVMRREVEIALRLARPRDDPSALTRKVATLAYCPCASRDSNPADLPWITYGNAMAGLPQSEWVRRQGEPLAALRVNDAEALLQAVRAGLGKALLPLDLLADLPVLVACGAVCLKREVWTMVHPELKDLARVRCVLEWISQTLVGLGGEEEERRGRSPSDA